MTDLNLSFKKYIIFCVLIIFFSVKVEAYHESKVKPSEARLESRTIHWYKKEPIQEFNQVITKNYKSQHGLFSTYSYLDTVYFEIPDSITERDIEVISRLSRGPIEAGAFEGEELNENTIKFKIRWEDSTIQIQSTVVKSEVDSGSCIFKSVSKSSLDPVIAEFKIKAFGILHNSYIIDVSDFIKSRSSFLNTIRFSPISTYADKLSFTDFFLKSMRCYPRNVELIISSNGLSKEQNGDQIRSPITIETHTSFIELPLNPMRQRISDARVGFNTFQIVQFNDSQQEVSEKSFIVRWRLEPKPEDIEKWKNGVIVEPQTPIVIYLDPATPKQWRPYLIEGISDWAQAFKQAGYKNAIIGKEWPEGDTTMDMEDARYNILNYFPSMNEDAFGLRTFDPRSGEIIQVHIYWHQNVMRLLHQWYLIQAGAVDPRARHSKFDEELMGELIRAGCSHEVGHTLGLTHNMGSSSQTPVDSLRSRSYLSGHGHTASIMDYSRYNYVAQPEDNIPAKLLLPRIGEYDRWAIEWGYRNANTNSVEGDADVLFKLTNDSLSKNSRLWYGSQQDPYIRYVDNEDPRCQTEDLGDNAAKASALAIKNLKRILPNLPEWTYEKNGIYNNLKLTYDDLVRQFSTYMSHVLKNVGGVWTTVQDEKSKLNVYAPVPLKLQRECLDLIDKELFTTPYWLLDTSIIEKINYPSNLNAVQVEQQKILSDLLSSTKIIKISQNYLTFGEKSYSLTEYISTIHKMIWKELYTGHLTDSYRRDLQKLYVQNMLDIIASNNKTLVNSDTYSIVRSDLKQLLKEIQLTHKKIHDPITKEHIDVVANRLTRTFWPNQLIKSQQAN